MNHSDDDSFPSGRSSCTRDETIAAMLGLMDGLKSLRYIVVNDNYKNESPALLDIEGRVQEYLIGMEKKFENDGDVRSAAHFKEINAKARVYFLAFDKELAEGKGATLQIDEIASEALGHKHYKILGVDRWARKTFGIPIIKFPTGRMEIEESIECAEENQCILDRVTTQSNNADVSPKLEQQGNDTRDKVRSENNRPDDSSIAVSASGNFTQEELDPKGGLSRTVAETLYTSFAFLVEAYAESLPRYRHEKDGAPNVSAIASRVAELAAKASAPDGIRGQRFENIENYIKEAMRIKRTKLPGRKR